LSLTKRSVSRNERRKKHFGRGPSGSKKSSNVELDDDVYADPNATLHGPVKVGKGSYIGPNCVIGFPAQNELGEFNRSRTIPNKKPTIIGENCILRSGTTIYSNVKIGDNVAFGHNVMVRENVTIGNQTKLGTNVVVDGSCSIGNNVSIQTGVYLCTYSTVEDSVFLGPCCVFTNDKFVMQKPFKLVGPTVRKGASIGANALLFPGVIVGEGAIVGAQAAVISEVAPKTIVVGIPAKKLADVPSDWHSSLL